MPCPSALRVFLIPCLWKATTLYIISLQAMSDGNDEEWLAACPTEPPQDVWHQECVHVHLKCNVRFVPSLTVLKLIYGNHWIYFLVFRDCWVFWNSIWPYYYFYSMQRKLLLPKYAGYNLHGILYPTMHPMNLMWWMNQKLFQLIFNISFFGFVSTFPKWDKFI